MEALARTTDIFILAGESSGDQIGADLMQRLSAQSNVNVTGVGGHAMQARGLGSLFPMEDLAVMGLVDVMARLPKLLYRLRQTRNFILRTQPHAVVLIDSQVFSAMLARRLRKAGYAGPILLYVAPTVWAYAPERAAKLVNVFDEVFAILPFEPQIMAELQGPATSFVGHPALARAVTKIQSEPTGRIALLPGSRKGELRRHMPMFGDVVARLATARPDLRFHLPTLPHIEDFVTGMMRSWPVKAEIVVDNARRSALAGQTELGLVASGTATLETALSGVPMVVTYVMDGAQRRAYKRLSIEHISLPNIILNEPLVPELLFDRPDPNRLAASMRDLLEDIPSRERQLQGFARMAEQMRQGLPDHPRCDPAERVLDHLAKKANAAPV